MRSTMQLRPLLAVILILAVPGSAESQVQASATRSVTVVELGAPPQGKRAMVHRRIAGADRDVIALAPEATGADLSTALRVLDALYARFGEVLEVDVAASTRSQTTPSRASARAELHESFVQQLRLSKARHVAGFGTVKAVEIQVPRRSSPGT